MGNKHKTEKKPMLDRVKDEEGVEWSTITDAARITGYYGI